MYNVFVTIALATFGLIALECEGKKNVNRSVSSTYAKLL